MSDTLKQLQRSDFEGHIGESFVVTLQYDDGSSEAYTLELVSVKGVGVKERDEAAFGRESFSLKFCNPDTERYLQQGLYPLEHDAFDELALFMVPIGTEDSGMCYEAIFT
jgi:hypothetical protein